LADESQTGDKVLRPKSLVGGVLHSEDRLFPPRLRRVLFILALFVLYSQLVSAGLTMVYRYSPSEDTFLDGGSPDIFQPGVFTLLQPPEGIGTITDVRAVGWRVEGTPLSYAAWAIVMPIVGSAAIFFATAAGRTWLPRCLLLLGSCLGLAAAVLIKLHEWAVGSIGWAIDAGSSTNFAIDYPPHPIYGYLEFIGSLFLPMAVYSAIVFFLVAAALGFLIRRSTNAISR
jgi:hypothetical protein